MHLQRLSEVLYLDRKLSFSIELNANIHTANIVTVTVLSYLVTTYYPAMLTILL